MIIGGGIAAVFVAFIAYKKHAANTASQSSAQVQQTTIPTASPISAQPDLGAYYSSTIPSAVGSAQTPSDSGNSGSTATGGGFDISSLLAPLVAGTINNNASQIVSNGHTSDSAILAGMNIAPGGSVSVTHTANGTTVTNSAPTDKNEAALTGMYQSILGRAPDAGGLVYWEDTLNHNPNISLNDVASSMKSSAEYKAAHPNG